MSNLSSTSSARRVAGSALVLLALTGCNQNDARAAAEPAQTSAAPSAAAPGEPQMPAQALAQPSYDEEAFTLTLAGPSSIQVGESVKLLVTLTAKNGFKVNDEYPVKFRPAPSPGLTFAKETIGKDDGEFEKMKVVLPVEVKAGQAGKHQAAGKFSFSVCTEDRCLIEKRDLSLGLTAS